MLMPSMLDDSPKCDVCGKGVYNLKRHYNESYSCHARKQIDQQDKSKRKVKKVSVNR